MTARRTKVQRITGAEVVDFVVDGEDQVALEDEHELFARMGHGLRAAVGARGHGGFRARDEELGREVALKLLKTAPAAEKLPLTLELKEKAGPEALNTLEQLAAARKALDRLEEEWD